MASLLDLAQARLQGLLDIPTRAARAIVNPTAFSGLLGAPTLPQMQGTAEAAYGLPARQNMSVLDPNQAAYLQGYQQGEPLAYLGAATPFAAPAAVAGAKAVAPKAGMAIENYMMRQGMMPSIYLPDTPLKRNPLVGTRFETESIGGLAEKKPVKIEDIKGSSIMIMPWDSTSRNVKVKSISDEPLAREVVTHGGQDYARDIKHIEQSIGGASNLEIAKRIRDRDIAARQENVEAGGTGNIIHLPTTMGAGAENFSVMPTEIYLSLLDSKNPSKTFVKDIDKSIREFKIAKGVGEDRVITQPFKNFKGIMTEEGRMQLYTGEGIDSTAGELRKAFADRMSLKANQEYLGFNQEDLTAAITDPALKGLPKGYVGNTILRTGEGGMHLKPSQNPTYSTDFTAEYLGSMGTNVPVEVLMPKTFGLLSEEFAGKKGNIRNMALGALEKRKAGVSELVDEQVIENYYKYLSDQKKLGLLD